MSIGEFSDAKTKTGQDDKGLAVCSMCNSRLAISRGKNQKQIPHNGGMTKVERACLKMTNLKIGHCSCNDQRCQCFR